ncbi:hypothetical protein C1645_740894 [Glomus cerebriforme]|uniref:Uncharacterized protein n=1 Tax=Glomus cerebriforme TaxID=658196 RepID=A0A397SR15_9GLOM|nr:hypothetical protein C1645_740894 [Glomus cerebriforme]
MDVKLNNGVHYSLQDIVCLPWTFHSQIVFEKMVTGQEQITYLATCQKQLAEIIMSMELIEDNRSRTIKIRTNTGNEMPNDDKKWQLISNIKSENDAGTSLGFKYCLESRKLQDLQTSFGKLFRIGALGGITWTMEILAKAKACQLILAHNNLIPEKSVSDDDQGSLSKMSEFVKDDVPKLGRKNNFMVVDTFDERVRRQLHTLILRNYRFLKYK